MQLRAMLRFVKRLLGAGDSDEAGDNASENQTEVAVSSPARAAALQRQAHLNISVISVRSPEKAVQARSRISPEHIPSGASERVTSPPSSAAAAAVQSPLLMGTAADRIPNMGEFGMSTQGAVSIVDGTNCLTLVRSPEGVLSTAEIDIRGLDGQAAYAVRQALAYDAGRTQMLHSQTHDNHVAAYNLERQLMTHEYSVSHETYVGMNVTKFAQMRPGDAFEAGHAGAATMDTVVAFQSSKGPGLGRITFDTRMEDSVYKMGSSESRVYAGGDRVSIVKPMSMTNGTGVVAFSDGHVRFYAGDIAKDQNATLDLFEKGAKIVDDGLDISADNRWIAWTSPCAVYIVHLPEGEASVAEYQLPPRQRPPKPKIVKLVTPAAEEIADCVPEGTVFLPARFWNEKNSVLAVYGQLVIQWSLIEIRERLEEQRELSDSAGGDGSEEGQIVIDGKPVVMLDFEVDAHIVTHNQRFVDFAADRYGNVRAIEAKMEDEEVYPENEAEEF